MKEGKAMKVILNKCFGGFRPSVFAFNEHAERHGVKLYWYELTGGGNYKLVENPNGFATPSTKFQGKLISFYKFDHGSVYKLDEDYRTDADLIDIVEKYGERASSSVSNLQVVEIPDWLDYVIDDYDGVETLHARVETW